jgi:A/G-specific adenine glycosylase
VIPHQRKINGIVSKLLKWFPGNARDLPWRRTTDPYGIYVSEIMLQQTQVKTVIPYWERWMRALPTIEALARARPAKIHKLWEGLGYYTRVRNMQKAAQQIIRSQSAAAADVSPLHLKVGRSQSRLMSAATVQCRKPRVVLATLSPSDGERAGVRGFPANFDAVLALPGIGRYTAGAICSIAFNQPTPILDGNVIRVLTRVYGIKTDPREKRTNARLWQLAEELVKAAREQENSTCHVRRRKRLPLPGESAGVRESGKTKTPNACSHLNQSLMELGALICTPRSPNCAACPIQNLCIAKRKNLQDQLPNLGNRVATSERRFTAYVVERNGKFLVHQRPAGVVNAHLWEFPNVEVAASAGRARLSVRGAPNIEAGTQRPDASYQPNDFRVTSTKPLRTIKHSITRYRITLEAWRAELAIPTTAPVSDPARRESTNAPGRRPALPGEWRTLTQLHLLAFTSAHKKILHTLTHAPSRS